MLGMYFLANGNRTKNTKVMITFSRIVLFNEVSYTCSWVYLPIPCCGVRIVPCAKTCLKTFHSNMLGVAVLCCNITSLDSCPQALEKYRECY